MLWQVAAMNIILGFRGCCLFMCIDVTYLRAALALSIFTGATSLLQLQHHGGRNMCIDPLISEFTCSCAARLHSSLLLLPQMPGPIKMWTRRWVSALFCKLGLLNPGGTTRNKPVANCSTRTGTFGRDRSEVQLRSNPFVKPDVVTKNWFCGTSSA